MSERVHLTLPNHHILLARVEERELELGGFLARSLTGALAQQHPQVEPVVLFLVHFALLAHLYREFQFQFQ